MIGRPPPLTARISTVEAPRPITRDSVLSPYLHDKAKEWLALPENVSRFEGVRFADSIALPGMSSAADRPTKSPWLLVHGNISSAADMAEVAGVLGREEGLGSNALYGYSYGANPDWSKTNLIKKLIAANSQGIDPAFIREVRAQLEFTLAETGAEKINVLGHSLGCSVLAAAIQGGPELGPSLAGRVNTSVFAGGGFQGLKTALSLPFFPSTNPKDGFFPGVPSLNPVAWAKALPRGLAALAHGNLDAFDVPVMGRSRAVQAILDGGTLGANVFSMRSERDEVVGGGPVPLGSILYGRQTSRAPHQDGELVFPFSAKISHLDLLGKEAATALAAFLRDKGVSQATPQP